MAKNNWMVEVLCDVATFAEENNLPKTHDAIWEAMVVATEEINRDVSNEETQILDFPSKPNAVS